MKTQPQNVMDIFRPIYDKLLEIRKSETVSLKPNPFLREEIVGFDGKPQPLKLRYYQTQGVLHLLLMPRMVLGDATGIGKTLQAIAAFTYLWATKEKDNKVIVFAPKSALPQWQSEILRFTQGVKTVIASGSVAERKKAYALFESTDEPIVLIMNYHIAVRDWKLDLQTPTLSNGAPDPKQPVIPGVLDRLTLKFQGRLVLVFDEASALKSMQTQTWQTCRYFADRARRVYGVTATLLKNRLEEGFSIYKVVRPDLFSTKSNFLDTYCVTKMQPVGGGKKIPIVVGYRNIDLFKSQIDPFFLGRQKHMVSKELPVLTTKEVRFDLSDMEQEVYDQALEGLLELGSGDVKNYEENKALVSLIYCQQIVNSLALLKYETGKTKLWSKEEAFVELIKEELDGDKVIVYTRYESHVERLRDILKAEKIKSVRVTGADNDKTRAAAQKAFQNLESDTKVIFITDAGAESINLQVASALIFYDAPWSWGNYLQIIGRMVRIGSPHTGVLVYHLIGNETIDEHVLKLLREKKNLIDKVLGEAAVGALEFKSEGSAVRDLLSSIAKAKK